MRILIIKRDKIGDLILTTPLLALIKSHMPSAELHLLANTYNGWVAKENPHIDRLWLPPRTRDGTHIHPTAPLKQLWQILQLRRQHYDFIIVANGSISWRANKRAQQIATSKTQVIAYCEPNQQQGIKYALPPPTHGHETERIVTLLTPLGLNITPDRIPYPFFRPPPTWLDSAKNFLTEHNLTPGSYIMLGVGTRRRTRQPEPAQLLRWAEDLYVRFGLHTVFTWSPGKRDANLYPGDDDIAEAVLTDCPNWIHPYQGKLNIVVGLTWLAKASIYPDSGLMHVAAASPGGVVGLFADPENSSSPDVWGPKGAHVRIVVAPQHIADVPDKTILSALTEILNLP